MPNTFCIIDPTFTINDAAKAEEGCAKMVEMTKTETGVMYYGFLKSQDGKTLVCREGYVDGEAVVKHLDNVGEYLGSVLEAGTIKLESLRIVGPKEQIEMIKPKTDPLGAVYYETTADDGFTFVSAGTGTEDKKNEFMTVYPTFEVPDWDKVDLAKYLDATKGESGCIYYGFAKNVAENKLICREAYIDGEAVNAHVGNVGEMLGKDIEDGVLKVASLAVFGPKDQIEVAKQTCDGFKPMYLEPVGDGGFVRFARANEK